MFNSFFDCLNVRNLDEGTRTRNPFLAPYTSTNDTRFTWLEEDFFGYLQCWKQSLIDNQDLTPKEREQMFLSRQTHEGCMISVYSLIETTRYVLEAGMPFFLPLRTGRIC